MSMARLLPVVIAVVLAQAPAAATTATDNAWLIVVDDLHVPFAQTGRLRDLLRKIAAGLIQDGDRYAFRASGPSAASLTAGALTEDRDRSAAAIKFMTGNALKDSDIFAAGSGTAGVREALYRANAALDAAGESLSALTTDAAPRQAIVYVSSGYDVDTHPALGDRVWAFARRARENNITIFVIDARGFGTLLLPDPPAHADAIHFYRLAARRSLEILAEETGGFVIEKLNEPGPDLARINAQMRESR
jgi:hypothetical protein